MLQQNDLRGKWRTLCREDDFLGENYWLDSTCKEAKVENCLTSDSWNIFHIIEGNTEGNFSLPASVSCGKYAQY